MTPDELRNRLAAFAHAVARFCRPLLTRVDARNTLLQLESASSSAAANYRAAGRARSRREFIAKLGLAREEADEAVFWLDHLVESGIIAAEDVSSLRREARELLLILSKSYSTARTRLETATRKRRG